MGFGRSEHLRCLTAAQTLTQEARLALDLDETRGDRPPSALDTDILRHYHQRLAQHPLYRRGTTHISVMDREGNIAGLTTSNEEGCGWTVPGTAILQVLSNLVDFNMPLADAAAMPRIHFEDGAINLETGFDETAVGHLASHYPVQGLV